MNLKQKRIVALGISGFVSCSLFATMISVIAFERNDLFPYFVVAFLFSTLITISILIYTILKL